LKKEIMPMLSQQRSVALIVAGLGYAIKFMAYGFLTPVVLLTFATLMFTYITLVGPELPFLQYFSFLLPIDGRGNASIDENDIMRAFGILTMAFFVISLVGGWFLRMLKRAAKRLFQPTAEVGPEEGSILVNQNPLSYGKRRLIISSIVIAVFFLIVFVAIPFARMAEGTSFMTMYPVFAVFGVIALVANALHIGVDVLSDVVLGWAWSRVLSSQESV
jgi:hypothetical protein